MKIRDVEQVSKSIKAYMKKQGMTEDDFMKQFCSSKHFRIKKGLHCSFRKAKRFFKIKGFGNSYNNNSMIII